MNINQLFDLAIERKASDLHLVPDYFPSIRVNNQIFQIRTTQLLTAEMIKDIILSLLNEQQKEIYFTNKELDFSYEYNNYRFRCNAYFTKGDCAVAFRLLDNKIRTIEELKLPPFLHQLTQYPQGLVLITGPTGEGKSTTLASIINEINLSQNKHIITIEDPIEYVYPISKSIISQRELHSDTHAWNTALKSALREDPDIVLVGEMRDYESIQLVLTIAETGHLVFSTLHTGSTPEAVNRIIDVFPSHQQNQVRSQLSSVLRVAIAQRLIPSIDMSNRLPALEILINTPAVSSLIREAKYHMLNTVLETSETEGMIIFEKYLLNMVNKGLISKETALSHAIRPNEIKKLIK